MKQRIVLAAIAAIVLSSCATDRHVRAVQQTAVGGGFVAVGTVAATSVVVGGVASGLAVTALGDGGSAAGLVVPLLVGGAFSAGVVGVGFGLMHAAEEDLMTTTAPSTTTTVTARPAQAQRRAAKPAAVNDAPRTKAERRSAAGLPEDDDDLDDGNPRAPSPDPWEMRRASFDDPRDRRSLFVVSDKLALAAANASTVAVHKALTIPATCDAPTLVVGEQVVPLTRYERIANSVRIPWAASPLGCDTTTVRIEACGASVTLAPRECTALQYVLDR